MKKLLFTLLISLCLLPCVNAETSTIKCNFTSKYNEYFERFGKDFVLGELNNLLQIYNSDYSNFSLYTIDVGILTNGPSYLVFTLTVYDENSKISWRTDKINDGSTLYRYVSETLSFDTIDIVYKINEDDSLTLDDSVGYSYNTEYLYFFVKDNEYWESFINPPFYSSFQPLFIMPDINNFSRIELQVSPDSNEYYYFDENADYYLFQPYSNYLGLNINDKNYTEVNLDNYEYVILNLKDYSKKEAFNTNLQVKGMIGITPVYEFGTAEKEAITDRCNLSYSDYTDYRFSILKNDLLNNAVYYVKACENGSSFKFDNTIFNATYITTENVNDPVITFGGVEYKVIPFDKLSNTANKNEDDNFIPGASEQFDPFGDVVDYILSFWNSLTTFMGLVTKFFNTLPIEIRAISITMFTTAITLGVIKFIKS